jgi:hypothetical protein
MGGIDRRPAEDLFQVFGDGRGFGQRQLAMLQGRHACRQSAGIGGVVMGGGVQIDRVQREGQVLSRRVTKTDMA